MDGYSKFVVVGNLGVWSKKNPVLIPNIFKVFIGGLKKTYLRFFHARSIRISCMQWPENGTTREQTPFVIYVYGEAVAKGSFAFTA